jgi:NADH-quinone oxidoreductase subunit C
VDPAAAPPLTEELGVEVAAIHERLLKHFGPDVILGLTAAAEGIRDPFVSLAPRRLDKVALFCKLEEDLRFDFLQSLTALHEGAELRLVYHLFSYPHRHSLIFKTAVPLDAPEVPSCVEVWPCADWYEREAFDLFGVRFAGHPDLRRLLLPEDWPGHPMRKDWKEPSHYNGMPTTRESPLDLLGAAGDGAAPGGSGSAGAAATKEAEAAK